ncbi:Tht1-like nuclear fusion protein-domain-containing protein [Myxozyma melibiosi]|uniref:Nuclear fusion protein KAR5 n=1 Tax=Myxozyma melibiosi TaxID=54550 RepID=A0ABR1FDP5_9ASCO
MANIAYYLRLALVLAVIHAKLIAAFHLNFRATPPTRYEDTFITEDYSNEANYAELSGLRYYSNCYLRDSSTSGADSPSGDLDPIFTKLCELSPPPSCFRDMLSSILPMCGTISTEERVVVSIKLTLCELSAAHVSRPLSCSGDMTASKEQRACMKEMKASPQLWTSFSGNFREIATICLAEKANYEKEEFIRLHQNITAIQAQLLHILKSQMADIYSEAKNVPDALASWHQSIVEVEKRLSSLDEYFSMLAANISNRLSEKTREMDLVLDKELERLTRIDGITADLLSRFEKDYTELHESSRSSLELMKMSREAEQEYVTQVNLDLSGFSEDIGKSHGLLSDLVSNLSNKLNEAAGASLALNEAQLGLGELISTDLAKVGRMSELQSSMLGEMQEAENIFENLSDAILDLQETTKGIIVELSDEAKNASEQMRSNFEQIEETVARFRLAVEEARNDLFGNGFQDRAIIVVATFILVFIGRHNSSFTAGQLVVICGFLLWPTFIFSIIRKISGLGWRYYIVEPTVIFRPDIPRLVPLFAVVITIFVLLLNLIWRTSMHRKTSSRGRRLTEEEVKESLYVEEFSADV